MKRELKRIKSTRADAEEIQRCLAEREQEYDRDGRAVINMNVKDDEGFLSPYSERATAVISPDVAEFIENSTYATPPTEPLTLRIYSDKISDEKKEEYTSAIREYYAQKYIVTKKTHRFNVTALISLAITGILTLLLAFKVDSHIWSEVIDIVAWVLIWEAVDIGAFKNRESNIQRKRYLSYMTMRIEFLPQKSEADRENKCLK